MPHDERQLHRSVQSMGSSSGAKGLLGKHILVMDAPLLTDVPLEKNIRRDGASSEGQSACTRQAS